MQEIGKCVGARVRQRRKELKMTQEQLEAASGVPQGSISRIESGVADDLHASTVLSFARALQVSTDYLFGVAPLRASARPAKRQQAKKTTPASADAVLSLEEGYRVMNAEHLQIAEEALGAIAEVVR